MPRPDLLRIGPYQVLRELGRGGMGVVHLARDPRLDRLVAIKALPEHLAADPDRLARFEREARTLAQLNHPNLAGIYGVEEQDGRRYLVLEYVEGPTLAERLDRGPLPLGEALEIAVQVAEGVEAAHEAGVVHRDLKPGNVIVTPEGRAKVLDFGLARVEEASSSTAADPHDPTRPSPAPHSPTIPGAILGTAPYMSPEQARGRRVDKRSDVWSFGVTLYEMLTGASPFAGETASDSIGAVLHKQVDLDRLPPATPPIVRHVLRRCLERDRALRLRDIGDARLELRGAMHGETWAPPGAGKRSRVGAAVALTAVITALAAAAVAWALRPAAVPPPPRSPAHLALALADDQPLSSRPYPRLSADGRRLVLRGDDAENSTILVRDLGDANARWLPGTGGAHLFGISPDGAWVLFDENDALYKMPIDGGPAVTICADRQLRGVAWGTDGTIVLAPDSRGPLYRVSAGGGSPEPLYELSGSETISDRHPAMLPRGRGVLFTRCAGDGADWGHAALWVVDLSGGEPKELVPRANAGRYLDAGYLVFQREDTLMAAGFDLDRLELTTPATAVLGGLTNTSPSVPAQFDVSPNGTLVYMKGNPSPSERGIDLVALDGTVSPLSGRRGPFWEVVPSDDGRFLAIATYDGVTPSHIDVLELGRDLLRPVPREEEGRDVAPVWSPDGRWLAFASNRRSGTMSIWRHRRGSASPPEPFVESDRMCYPEDWSSDGRTLLVTIENERNTADLAVVRLDEHGEPTGAGIQPFVEWPGNQYQARFSPDGRWVLFESVSKDGDPEIFVVDASDPSRSVQVSTDGGAVAVWAPDHDRIYYAHLADPGLTMEAVDFQVREDGAFVPSSPQRLFDLAGARGVVPFSMTPDGKAFVVPLPVDGAAKETRPLPRIVLHWDEEVRRKVASGG